MMISGFFVVPIFAAAVCYAALRDLCILLLQEKVNPWYLHGHCTPAYSRSVAQSLGLPLDQITSDSLGPGLLSDFVSISATEFHLEFQHMNPALDQHVEVQRSKKYCCAMSYNGIYEHLGRLSPISTITRV
ncbi:hypothetical protein B0H12DRAFT_264627 [Mycena haematopus]|nr:hypothetical protein B0H12DRAFT_264627 [Mycena haematopus]